MLKGRWTVRWEGLGRQDDPGESGRRTVVRCHIRMSQFVVALHGMNSSWPEPFLHSMLSNKGLVLHSLRPSNAR